ncbi:Hypothetical predicted protein [Octopus vulgaris]|uniref:Uncharacterized protein n=1 Tax=Octopus vulgaris TaxID=6645 RepID=A0AA36B2W2_OCTVU|nr:Hypothetical predicted protein [Octopus vulgaris]
MIRTRSPCDSVTFLPAFLHAIDYTSVVDFAVVGIIALLFSVVANKFKKKKNNVNFNNDFHKRQQANTNSIEWQMEI